MQFHTKKHKIRTFSWESGLLKIIDQWFDSFEEALEYINHHDGPCHHHKVYNERHELVHTVQCPGHHHGGTYA